MDEHRDLWWPSPSADLARVVQLEQGLPFTAQHGGRLERIQVSYESWGELNAARDNAVLVVHPMTADTHASGDFDGQPLGWWEPLIGPGRAIDTERLFVICPNLLGGCYGTTGPRFPGEGEEPPRPWLERFPLLTPLDMMRVQRMLLDRLDIDRLRMVIGPSMGGMVAWEWAVEAGAQVDLAVVVAAPLRTTAYQIGLNWLQRRGIELDIDGDEVIARFGQMLARGIGMLSYRAPFGMEEKFGREWFKKPGATLAERGMFNVESWLRHHGKKITRRFDPYTWILYSRAMDLHDLGRERDGLLGALDRVECPVLLFGISSDNLYPAQEVRLGADMLRHLGRDVEYAEIRSLHGHDGFLLETEQIAARLEEVLERGVGEGAAVRVAGRHRAPVSPGAPAPAPLVGEGAAAAAAADAATGTGTPEGAGGMIGSDRGSRGDVADAEGAGGGGSLREAGADTARRADPHAAVGRIASAAGAREAVSAAGAGVGPRDGLQLVRVGLLGAGRVAADFAGLLARRAERLAERHGLVFDLAALCEIDADRRLDERLAGVRRLADPAALVADPTLDVLVELTRGSDPSSVVERFLRSRRPVLTPNKRLIHDHGERLERAAVESGVRLAYHASIAAGWALLYSVERPLEQGNVRSIKAMVSSTCNVVLEQLESGRSPEQGVAEARRLGLAEDDPLLDLGGWDTAQKLALLVARALGRSVPVALYGRRGIDGVAPELVRAAPPAGFRIKLVGLYQAREPSPAIAVLPAAVVEDGILGSVRGADNAVVLDAEPSGELVHIGSGGGSMPVATALVGDLVGLFRPEQSWTALYPRCEIVPGRPAFGEWLGLEKGRAVILGAEGPGTVPLLRSLRW